MGNARFFGDRVKSFAGMRPQAAQAAGAVNGIAIDRTGAQSAELFAFTGADTGAPTTRTLATKIQDSDDGSTGWADVTGLTASDVTAINSEQRASIDLTKTSKKFIRVVHTVSFTGGTSPTLFIGSTVVLGGFRSLPQ